MESSYIFFVKVNSQRELLYAKFFLNKSSEWLIIFGTLKMLMAPKYVFLVVTFSPLCSIV